MTGIIRRTVIDMIPVVEDELIDTTIKNQGYLGRHQMVGIYIESAGNLVFMNDGNVFRGPIAVTDFMSADIYPKMIAGATTASGLWILIGGM